MRKRKYSPEQVKEILENISVEDALEFERGLKFVDSEYEDIPKESTIKDLILEKDEYESEEGDDVYNFHTENINSWPHIKEVDDNEGTWSITYPNNSESQELDLENVEYKIIDDDYAVVECGGDWQDCFTVVLKRNTQTPTVDIIGILSTSLTRNGDKIEKYLKI